MNARQENYLTMALTVDRVLKSHEDVWGGLDPFVKAAEGAEGLIEEIQEQVRKQEESTKAHTERKEAAKEQMARLASKLGGLGSVLAEDQGEPAAAKRLQKSFTSIYHQARDTRAPELAQIIYDELVKLDAVERVQYGVTDARLDALDDAIQTYRQVLSNPQEVGKETSVATDSLPPLIARLREEHSRMDRLVLAFEEEAPSFVAEFQKARNIPDDPGGREAEEPLDAEDGGEAGEA